MTIPICSASPYFFEGFYFGHGRPGNDHMHRIVVFEIHERALGVIDLERAADTAPSPSLDEQVGERLRALRALEDILLFDLNPGRLTPLRAIGRAVE